MIKQLYYAYVYPHVSYGVELYGCACQTYKEGLQTVHNRILKILSSKPQRYSTIPLHNELDLLTIEHIHDFSVACFVYKQCNNMLPRVFRQYFQYNYEIRNHVTSKTMIYMYQVSI